MITKIIGRWVRSGSYNSVDSTPLWRKASESELADAKSRKIPTHWCGPVGIEPVGGTFESLSLNDL